MYLVRAWITITVAGMVVACSPTFDWRDVRSADGLVALFPCRPDVHSRKLEIAGDPVTMELSSCDTGGLTFALGRIVAADLSRVAPIQQSLRDAQFAKLSSSSPTRVRAQEDATSAAVTAASQPLSQSLTVQGTGPDGEALQVQSRFFSRGLTVYQATVLGRKISAESAEPFFSSLVPQR